MECELAEAMGQQCSTTGGAGTEAEDSSSSSSGSVGPRGSPLHDVSPPPRRSTRRRGAPGSSSGGSSSIVAQVVHSIFSNVLVTIETSEVLAGLGELRVAGTRHQARPAGSAAKAGGVRKERRSKLHLPLRSRPADARDEEDEDIEGNFDCADVAHEPERRAGAVGRMLPDRIEAASIPHDELGSRSRDFGRGATLSTLPHLPYTL